MKHPSALWIVTLTAQEHGANLTDIRCDRAGHSKRDIAGAMRCTPSSVVRYLEDQQ